MIDMIALFLLINSLLIIGLNLTNSQTNSNC